MLYKLNQKNIVKEIRKIPFEKEKSIQNIIEKSLDEIFGYRFIKSEIKIGNFRLDTIAYNPETKAFVILEYKNTKNDSLIDQGYSYLNAIINKKAELILLYTRDMMCCQFNLVPMLGEQKHPHSF